MTPYSVASRAYGESSAPLRTPRSMEYDLLAKCTMKLRNTAPKRDSDFPAFVQALSDNLKLWTVLASDVASPNNSLPSALRAQLFYLYEFTDLHTKNVRDNKISVDVLIDINTAVMKGLRGQSEVVS